MGDAAGSPPPLRIVICPWLAFGHMLPYLELAERLASRGHRVSYVSTPRNLARLPPLRQLAGDGAVDLVALTLPRVEGLPDGAESTNDVPGDRLEPLWQAFDALAAPFADYLAAACAAGESARPDWVLGSSPTRSTTEPPSSPASTACRKPLVPLGLLPPSPDGGRAAGAAHEDDNAAVRWLNLQPAKSVVYVALGSEVLLRVELVHELAYGLELAGTRFLWALRKPRGVADDDVLPAGFLERPNSRLMEGRKVGLMVARNEDDGSFDRHGIASAVKGVMVEEDTRKIFVENAKKMQEIVADKELQDRYVDEFVQHLRSYITDHGNFSAADVPPPVEI
ncbi:unnamed protein product [Urochloa decumbens]|uniref:Uncharacterized protein n=1 Tax=Urochloa decumbens TaxID=240449 RepID=A0ABC9AM61_9POAL